MADGKAGHQEGWIQLGTAGYERGRVVSPTAIWLQDIPTSHTRRDRASLTRAARLLGRLAANPRARPLATVDRFSR